MIKEKMLFRSVSWWSANAEQEAMVAGYALFTDCLLVGCNDGAEHRWFCPPRT
jgi:hypothetical protein